MRWPPGRGLLAVCSLRGRAGTGKLGQFRSQRLNGNPNVSRPPGSRHATGEQAPQRGTGCEMLQTADFVRLRVGSAQVVDLKQMRQFCMPSRRARVPDRPEARSGRLCIRNPRCERHPHQRPSSTNLPPRPATVAGIGPILHPNGFPSAVPTGSARCRSLDRRRRHLAADLVRGAAAPAANTNLPTLMTAERVAGWITAQGREPCQIPRSFMRGRSTPHLPHHQQFRWRSLPSQVVVRRGSNCPAPFQHARL
jgi:hypothetical protein